ncbi:hypothetical protein KQI08_03710 [Paraeggerthella hongkongensis]|uniref:hypothetical protein n=1 Tax=Paraeggerthella hominis TaxID=2897351 RepID=UPI001C102EBB|nr:MULTISPECIES: hypothetical protein [Paraeggerthella]MBU5405027.1 hypothetical protein [Paraeggerthella hongkongensis]MCD2432882.1 hypothetical protein [Paraeggerthella hominis]
MAHIVTTSLICGKRFSRNADRIEFLWRCGARRCDAGCWTLGVGHRALDGIESASVNALSPETYGFSAKTVRFGRQCAAGRVDLLLGRSFACWRIAPV